jgi:hypothetical protein
MQQGLKGLKPKTAAMFEEDSDSWKRHQRTKQETGAMSEKPEDINETLGQTFKLEVMKQAVVTSVRWRKTSIRILWRDRPPPKRKKKELQTEWKPVI